MFQPVKVGELESENNFLEKLDIASLKSIGRFLMEFKFLNQEVNLYRIQYN